MTTADAAVGNELERSPSFLAEYGVKINEKHMTLVLPPDMEFKAYQEIVAMLGVISSAVPFYIGDMMLYGERTYGDAYAQAMNDTGLAYQTLANYVNVARWVEPDVRRSDLSHGHHAAVANMVAQAKDGTKLPDKERQLFWLDQAATKQWSRGQLREAISVAAQPGVGTDADNQDAAAAPGPADPPPALPPAEAPEGSLGTTPYDREREQALLHVLRDAYDSAVPVSLLANPQGYYGVPQDVVEELALALGEEFTPEPYDNGDFRPPPVVEGTATAVEDDDEIPMHVEQPGDTQGPVPHVDPPQPVQTTRSGTPALRPDQVLIGGQPVQVPAAPPAAPDMPGPPVEVPPAGPGPVFGDDDTFDM